jgi:WD40 repeat protein
VLLDAHTGVQLGPPLHVATGVVDPISFSPDGRLFVATSTDQTSTLWDVRSRKRLGTSFAVEPASIPVVRFAPNGDLVIDNLADTAVWPTRLGAWERFACQVAGRDLTRAEWSDLLPGREYRPVCRR